MRFISAALAAVSLGSAAVPTLAWDAHGHRTITLLGIDRFQTVDGGDKIVELEWVFTPDSRAQAAYQSGEPDRYRAIKVPYLRHENEPEHYIDLEDLEQFGLTLSTIPPLRYEYVRALVVAKHEHPDGVKPYNERTDPVRTQEWPGYLPYAIMEHWGKLVSSFRQVRVLTSLNDPARANQLAAAKANVIYEMGQLSHFVGDAAQPLHTTQQHHGWVGDNPNGYTTDRGFHSYIDGKILVIHGLSHDSLKGTCDEPARVADPNDPFRDVLAHIQRSYDQMRPLYELQKSGELEKAEGKAFISERLCDGGAMLGDLYAAAWKASAMNEQEVKDFLRYDGEAKGKPGEAAPAAKGGASGKP